MHRRGARPTRRLDGIADAFLDHDRPIAHPVDDSVVRMSRRRPDPPAPGARLRPVPAATAGPHRGMLALRRGPDEEHRRGGHRRPVSCSARTSATSTRAAARGGVPAAPRGCWGRSTDRTSRGWSATAIRTTPPRSLRRRRGFPASRPAPPGPRPGLPARAPARRRTASSAWPGTAPATVRTGRSGAGSSSFCAKARPCASPACAPSACPAARPPIRDGRRTALGARATRRERRPRAARPQPRVLASRRSGSCARCSSAALNSPVTSSAGRLFDAAGALLGIGFRNSFEGQVPLAVEAAAGGCAGTAPILPFPCAPSRAAGRTPSSTGSPCSPRFRRPALREASGRPCRGLPRLACARDSRGRRRGRRRDDRARRRLLPERPPPRSHLGRADRRGLRGAGSAANCPPTTAAIAAGPGSRGPLNITSVELPR